MLVGLSYRRKSKECSEGVKFSSDTPVEKIEISILKIKVKPTRQETQKQAHLHTLRHSLATHRRGRGEVVRYIKSLHGRSGSKAAELYNLITTKGFENLKAARDD